eukprot:TRINITY_DN24147_c0_g1_i1.p1 TRINITY_DN24147_c0_g1~~TRINITY_DN24147_c0_g1_i1.p1  ORF type:complete len:224 (-),score=31.57 TRINITY_DN24147_c0_g1_i1:207-806(-)
MAEAKQDDTQALAPQEALQALNSDLTVPEGKKTHRTKRLIDAFSVRGHLFSFLPAMEGKWSGDCKALDGSEMSSSLKVEYKDDGTWFVRTTCGEKSGVSHVESLTLEPSFHGLCKVTHAQPAPEEASSSTTYQEHCGDLFATMTTRCVQTGEIQKQEIWALEALNCDKGLKRTITLYKNGEPSKILVSHEKRLVAEEQA